jgi:RimJ/RimL family protein N-acetyltransferase
VELQPVLENGRYRIEPLKMIHKDALLAIASDPLLWDQHPAKERATKEGFDEFFEQSLTSGGALAILDKETGSIVGSSRFQLHEDDPKAVQIGWTYLDRNYWGIGANKDIKAMMIEHAFSYMDRVLLYIDHQNFRSQAAARKIGAVQVTKEQYPLVYRDRPDYTTFIIEKN